MKTSESRRRIKSSMKSLALALALVLPGSAAMAASMTDVVRTRADQNIDQQYGRDSVYAFSTDAKPLKPEQTGSHDTNIFGTVKNYAAEGWQKTEGFLAGLWDRTTGLFQGSHAASSESKVQPQAYGRAGGYIGAGRIAVLESDTAFQANATPNVYQANGTPAELKTGIGAYENSVTTTGSVGADSTSAPTQSGTQMQQ